MSKAGSKLGVKYRPVIEKDIFMKFDTKCDPQDSVKINLC
jgi:hypothetical protein